MAVIIADILVPQTFVVDAALQAVISADVSWVIAVLPNALTWNWMEENYSTRYVNAYLSMLAIMSINHISICIDLPLYR